MSDYENLLYTLTYLGIPVAHPSQPHTCYRRFKRELHDTTTAPFILKMRMHENELADGGSAVRMYEVGSRPGTFFSAPNATRPVRTLLLLLVRTIGFQRRQRTDHLMSSAKADQNTQRESVNTMVPKQRFLFAGLVPLMKNRRLSGRVVFRTIACGEDLV